MNENKERFLFLISVFIIIIMSFFTFSKLYTWEEVDNSGYIFEGKYLVEELNEEKLSKLPKISKNNAKEIMKHINTVKKLKDFKFIKGIGNSKNKILKNFINF